MSHAACCWFLFSETSLKMSHNGRELMPLSRLNRSTNLDVFHGICTEFFFRMDSNKLYLNFDFLLSVIINIFLAGLYKILVGEPFT